MEPQKYNGWLVSNSFLKRSFAVLGHATVAQLIISIPFYAIMIIILLAFGDSFTPSVPETEGQVQENQEQEVDIGSDLSKMR